MKLHPQTNQSQPAGHQKRRQPRNHARRDAIVITLGVIVSVALMIWPWVLDRLNAAGVFNTISSVSSTVAAMDPEEKERYLVQARSYNERLAGQTPELADEQIWPYGDQLTYERDPMMSWVEIPSINVSMPIYHGTSESVLMSGVGHLEGTSLPVGGASTHCVLTAHSGMANTRMFDDVGKLQPGDLVLLHTMGDTLAYRMSWSEVVWPDEVDHLDIQDGQDLVTLVTCTPYGVNDHRLLVHCERTDYTPQEVEEQSDVAHRHWGMREWAVVVVVAGLLLLLVIALFRRIRRHRRS